MESREPGLKFTCMLYSASVVADPEGLIMFVLWADAADIANKFGIFEGEVKVNTLAVSLVFVVLPELANFHNPTESILGSIPENISTFNGLPDGGIHGLSPPPQASVMKNLSMLLRPGAVFEKEMDALERPLVLMIPLSKLKP